MTPKPISRRAFLKAAGITICSTALIGTGLAVTDEHQPVGTLPEFTFGEKNMEKRILVTYASCTGSTAGVAEAIGKTLAEGGTQVDVLPMNNVKDLASYKAVVAGSAIQGAQWLPEARQFLQSNRAELARKPFAAFLVCMTLAMKNGQYREHVATMMDPVRAQVRPLSEGLFAGVLDCSKMPSFADRLKFRLSVLLGVWQEGDHRDWTAIRTWAEDLRPMLLQ